jgi:PBP1b-binding outer membrane lipoprotein LpoB
MRLLLIALFLSGCSALPFEGTVLEAIAEDPPTEVEPVSCQCNVYCAV